MARPAVTLHRAALRGPSEQTEAQTSPRVRITVTVRSSPEGTKSCETRVKGRKGLSKTLIRWCHPLPQLGPPIGFLENPARARLLPVALARSPARAAQPPPYPLRASDNWEEEEEEERLTGSWCPRGRAERRLLWSWARQEMGHVNGHAGSVCVYLREHECELGGMGTVRLV